MVIWHKAFGFTFVVGLMIWLSARGAQIPTKDPAAQPSPTIGAATIKHSDPNDGSDRFFRVSGSHFLAHQQTVANLIEWAFGLQERQVLGGPSWSHSASFDIEAVPEPEANYPRSAWPPMLQQLLADRFSLSYHHETRDLAVFVLVQAKGGSKLRATNTEGTPTASGIDTRSSNGLFRLIGHGATMPDLAAALKSVVVGRPVIDQTGIHGQYDFDFSFQPNRESNFSAQGSEPSSDPEFFTAIQEQLGLKLIPSKTAVDVLVIDSVAEPSSN